MKSEEIRPFIGHKAKLVLDNDYVLRGTLEQVNEDNILFRTTQAASLIRLDAVKGIVF